MLIFASDKGYYVLLTGRKRGEASKKDASLTLSMARCFARLQISRRSKRALVGSRCCRTASYAS